MNNNPAFKILIENAKTFSERNKIFGLMKAEMATVNNTMISNLYRSAIDKAHVDFESIPVSAGDITKYVGYTSMLSCISIVREIAVKSNIKISDLDVVETAIRNITAYRESFEKGFKLEKDFIILQYNALVYACVEAVSTIISSYVDYIKRPDKIDFTVIRSSKHGGWLCISNLDKFNKTVKTGDFSKVINGIIATGKQSFVGIDDIIVPAIIMGGVLVLVPLVRELIFYFFYSRMRISDYLKQQASFIELNKISVNTSSSLTNNKKRDILRKQSDAIKILQSWADKINVNHKTSEPKSMDEIHKENKSWSINNIQYQSASSDEKGFKLL